MTNQQVANLGMSQCRETIGPAMARPADCSLELCGSPNRTEGCLIYQLEWKLEL